MKDYPKSGTCKDGYFNNPGGQVSIYAEISQLCANDNPL